MQATDITMVRNYDTSDPDLVSGVLTGEPVEVTAPAPPTYEGCVVCGLFAGEPSQLDDWGGFNASELLKRTAHLIVRAIGDGEEDIEDYFADLLDDAQLLLEMAEYGVTWRGES